MRSLRLLRLFRPRLVLLNGVAALAGYLLFPAPVSYATLLCVFTGVCLLAAAGSALNQVMERDLDALMARTRNRPLVTGLLTRKAAVLIATACVIGGSVILHQAHGVQPAFPLPKPPSPGAGTATVVGLLALAWYLLIYTPLKRRTSLALLIGTLSGAAPPLIGWSAAGGSLFDYRIILLTGILFLWQVPHFWLLQRRHSEDYRRAGFPLLELQHRQGGSLPLMIWICAMAAATMMLPAFGVVAGKSLLWAACAASLLVLSSSRHQDRLFPCLNLFPLIIAILICAGR